VTTGKVFASDARNALAEVERALARRIGSNAARALREFLDDDWGSVA
jgi:hypothetical protein